MTNVITQLRNIAANAYVNFDHAKRRGADIEFDVVEQDLYYRPCARGEKLPPVMDKDNKQLLRRRPTEYTKLATVGREYNVIENGPLFRAIEGDILQRIPHDKLRNVDIISKEAYEGQTCYREYIFRDIIEQINEQSTVCFRANFRNGFGGASVGVFVGGYDTFCWNGMVSGVAEKIVKRHTKGLQTSQIVAFVGSNLERFHTDAARWRKWATTKITAANIKEFLDQLENANMLSQRLRSKMEYQIGKEVRTRGATVWSVYSALTYYATHPEDELFAVRKTGNDTTAVMVEKREKDVHAIVKHKAFRALETV